MKKIILSTVVFTLLFSFFLVVEASSSAAESLQTIFSKIQGWFFSFLIAGAVLGVLIGSFNILLSGGDPGKANTGKMIIIYSLVAVLVGVFALGLVNAVRNLVS